jgi:hypothetical protein
MHRMGTLSIRPQAACVATLLALAGGAFGCGAKAKPTATQGGVATQPSGRAAEGVIELGPQTLTFTPTRDDLTIRCVTLAVLSSHPVRINGVQAQPFNYLYLMQVGKNQFELPALRIEFVPAASPDAPERIGLLALKVWFNEVTNQADSDLYENRDDRYALVSWCSNPPELLKDTSYRRNAQNRVQTPSAFRERLAQPFELRMKRTPLSPGWGYPATTGGGGGSGRRELSQADLNAVKQIMRDRGERYLVSIVASDATHANVEASIGDMTRYQGTRHYQLALKGVWQVESMVEEPNVARLVADR